MTTLYTNAYVVTMDNAGSEHDGWLLVEGTGKRPMVPRDDPRHPKYRPKMAA